MAARNYPTTPMAKRRAELALRQWYQRQPWETIKQDVHSLMRAAPLTYDDTEKQERAARSIHIRTFLGLAVDEKGNIAYEGVHPLGAELARLSPQAKEALHLLSEELDATYSESTFSKTKWIEASMYSPHVARAEVKMGDLLRRSLLNGSRNFVLKAHHITDKLDIVPGEGRNRDYVVEVINSIVAGKATNELMSRYSTSVTPHFAYLIDWFAGPPGLATGEWRRRQGGSMPRPNSSIVQYMIEEDGGDASLLSLGDKMTAGNVKAAQYQLLHALEAFWLTMGGRHGDIHRGNFRFKTLLPGESGYANATLAYSRPNVEGFVLLPASLHGNLFPIIIDMGRARCWVPTREEVGPLSDLLPDRHESDHRCLTGPEDGHIARETTMEHFGVARRDVQPGRDVQMLGIAFLMCLNLEKMGYREKYNHTFHQIVGVIGIMVHTRFCFAMLVDAIARLPSTSSMPSILRDRVRSEFNRHYAAPTSTCDSYGSDTLFHGTMALNRLLYAVDAAPIRRLFEKIMYDLLITDESPQRLARRFSEGRRVFATPTDCLDLVEAWKDLRHLAKDGPLPPGTVPTGIVLPSQVMRDPWRNRTGIKDEEIPLEHRRFLPHVPRVRTEGAAILARATKRPRRPFKAGVYSVPSDSDSSEGEQEEEEEEDKQRKIKTARMEEVTTEEQEESPRDQLPFTFGAPATSMLSSPSSTPLSMKKCAFCERQATVELVERPGLTVCSALCGQMFLIRTSMEAVLLRETQQAAS